MSSKANRNEKATERRAAIEAIRKEQQAKERRRTLAGAAGLLVIVVGLGVAVVLGTRGHHAAASGPEVLPAAVTSAQGTTTYEKPATKVPNTSGIPGVVAYDTAGWPTNSAGNTANALPHNHVTGPVVYSVLPPVGGDHNGVWMNAGVYTKAIPSERAVHNLEHGAIWITYRPNLPASEVKALQDFVGKQSLIDEGAYGKNRYMDLSPWANNGLPSPIVISSWGYQLYVTSPTDPRLQEFVNKFRHNQTYTPEFGAAVDGQPVIVSGRAAMYGDTLANPAS